MKKFKIKTYELATEKMKPGKTACFAFLTDLHGVVYGENNRILLDTILAQKPDGVLVAGDMFVRSLPETMPPAVSLLKKLAREFPVYYALGNHEYQMAVSEDETWRGRYKKYEEELSAFGVKFLHNEQASLEIGGTEFVIHGLELPMEYYKKPRSPHLEAEVMDELLKGTPNKERYHIVLAHNPKYGEAYLKWGADLTLCGHYHGGVVRLTERIGLSSPQYLLFPPYCCGDFHRGESHLLVSPGLGEHTIPIRIHNPRELFMIYIKHL